jgi:malate dehydrogenase (oxaloacetate-decarboxylating)(NADP+)
MAKSRRKDALDFHSQGRPGKIQVVSTKPLTTQRDLALAYSPGVAEPCMEIFRQPDDVYRYTARGNLVAVVTNGTAVLGLGDLGPLASKPVMEGKGVLFKKFADIDVFDIELAEIDPDRIVDCVCALEPTFGGINLEDIKAPECFYIEAELKRRMKIPVFHDDQHGTAIISGAALLNAVELQGKSLDALKVVVSGAGASAVASSRFYLSLGVRAENLLMVDSRGVIHDGRTDLGDVKAEFAQRTAARSLADALVGADLFLGLSRGGLVTSEMVQSMGPRPIIFALANPEPEIGYEEARRARPDAIVATGRSDFNNQVNNVLGFPGIFRGALDVRATAINEPMKIAAARALAELARKDVPETVSRAYGNEFTFGPEYIIPKPFDPRVIQWVAPAVARAAVDSGVARIEFDDLTYRERMRTLLGGATAIMRRFVARAQKDPRRIVFPEGIDPRILRACAMILDEGIARPVLLGDPERVRAAMVEHDIELDPSVVEIINPPDSPDLERYAAVHHRRRERKGIDRERALQQLRRRAQFGMMMVAQGDADGVVSGITLAYRETVLPAIQLIGLAPGIRRCAGMYVMLHRSGPFFFADTTVNVHTDAAALADIAEMVADEARRMFDLEPRVAFLGYSNFGSVRTADSERVSRACEMFHQRRPDIECDGELQANVAVDFGLQRHLFPFTRLTGPANVLIFPNLEAGNVAYKLMRELGGVPAVGPVLLGMARPITVLERDCTVDDVVHMTALTVVRAQALAQQRERAGL